MLEKILKLYTMAMAFGVRSPLPHLFGPPGCGKSTVAEQAAELLGVKLHIINLSRVSPLDLEGVQMPVTEEGESMKLRLLHATFWTQIEEGDIVLFDEALRAFPEVFNGLLDILTSRQVGGLILPKFFAMAASNSVISYDRALADRLLHLPVEDPRTKKSVRTHMAKLMVEQIGLLPVMATSMEMEDLIQNEICPMFSVLDDLTKGSGNGGGAPTAKGRSIRNLIGQAQLREVQSNDLATLLQENNRKAMAEGKPQYVVVTDGKAAQGLKGYVEKAKDLVGNDKLTELQAMNLNLNLQLVELEDIRKQKGTTDDDIADDDIFTS